MITMTTTGYLVIIASIVIAIYDGIAVTLNKNAQNSVSYWFNRLGVQAPTFALVIGILVGHFFAPLVQVISK